MNEKNLFFYSTPIFLQYPLCEIRPKNTLRRCQNSHLHLHTFDHHRNLPNFDSITLLLQHT